MQVDFDIRCDEVLEQAFKIAWKDLQTASGNAAKELGCLGGSPGGVGYEVGVWLADGIWTLIDGTIHGASPEYVRDYLFSQTPGSLGLISFFAQRQETEGEHRGNIPVAVYARDGDGGNIDTGGFFDLAFEPRKNYRDEVPAGAFFIHGIHKHWKFYNDDTYLKKYFQAMNDYMEYRKKGLDEETGLFLSVYGLGDLSIDRAVPASVALLRTNSECMRIFHEFSEMADCIGEKDIAGQYRSLAQRMKNSMNTVLWDDRKKYYATKIFKNPTTDKESPFYNMQEDNRFHIEGNMAALYAKVPDDEHKLAAMISEIEKIESKRPLYGTSIYPPFPDQGLNWRMHNHRYWNGDIWPCFGGWYSIALFREGYPSIALEVVKRYARMAVRDNGFYEYYEGSDQEGKGLGAFHYCFTAAPYVAALVEGLFGLSADYPNGILYIHPSLRQSGKIACQVGKHSMSMDVGISRQEDVIRLELDTDYSGKADFRVLTTDTAKDVCVVRDSGKIVPASIKKTAEATYVCFEDDLQGDCSTFEISVS